VNNVEPLFARDLDDFERILQAEKRMLRTRLKEMRTGSDEARAAIHDGQVSDTKDESSFKQLSDTYMAETARLIVELAKVDVALTRVATGSYGTCERCGRDIGLERLTSQPTADRCLPCQMLRESQRAKK